MHQREPVFPTEVNELDLSDAAVKVHTCEGEGTQERETLGPGTCKLQGSSAWSICLQLGFH